MTQSVFDIRYWLPGRKHPYRTGMPKAMDQAVVYCDEPGATEEKDVFTSNVTFANIGPKCKADTLPFERRQGYN